MAYKAWSAPKHSHPFIVCSPFEYPALASSFLVSLYSMCFCILLGSQGFTRLKTRF